VPAVKSIEYDPQSNQLHRLRCTFANAGAATVVELVRGVHVPPACTLSQVHAHGITAGTATTYQPDIHEAAAGESSVPAGSAKMFDVGSAVAVANQSNVAKIGGMVMLTEGRSLYVRIGFDSGADNSGVVDVYFKPTVMGA
jgi:hypothetical protein